jgi:ATP-dependent Clp protease ATP-binding subunit ClpC
MRRQIEVSVKRVFSPEFLNRLDDTITFKQLTRENIFSIIAISTAQLLKRIQSLGISFEFDDSAKDFLSDKGYDPKYGARPLRRAIQKYIEDPVSEEVLKGTFKDGSKVKVSHIEGKDELTFTDTAAASKETKEPEPVKEN